MKLQVRYCEANIDLMLPNSWEVDLYNLPSHRLPFLVPDHWLFRKNLPSGLLEFLNTAGELVIVVNDQYRPTPTALVLNALSDALDPERTVILVSTGLHEGPSVVEAQRILGSNYNRFADKMHVHSAYDDDQLEELQRDGWSVRLNHLLLSADAILTIGSVEPHYFAGFTGGRKIVLPGCASFEDIRINHSYAIGEGSRPLATYGNPVWEDIQVRTSVLDRKRQYTVQLICDYDGNLYDAVAGEWDKAFERSADFAKRCYAHPVEHRYDIVICVVYPPLDRNLYQLQKSYENVAEVVRDEGVIWLISGCRDGVGDQRFLDLAHQMNRSGWSGSVDDYAGTMGIHKVVRTLRLAERIDLILTSTLSDDVLGDLPIQPSSVFAATVTRLEEKYGNKCRTAVVLDSASQVLYRAVA